jgi:hypothetical protein
LQTSRIAARRSQKRKRESQIRTSSIGQCDLRAASTV